MHWIVVGWGYEVKENLELGHYEWFRASVKVECWIHDTLPMPSWDALPGFKSEIQN